MARGRGEPAFWALIGDEAGDVLLAMKRIGSVPVGGTLETALVVPSEEMRGLGSVTLFIVCDTYIGLDRAFELPLLEEAVSPMGKGAKGKGSGKVV